jgi:hypothetical protein
VSDKARNYDQELAALMDGLAESVFELPDDEVRAEMGGEKDSPERAGNIMRLALKDCRQKLLIEAQRRHDEHVAAWRQRQHSIPDSIDEQRKLLNSLLARTPALGAALLTAQHRDFTDLPDEDVTSYLRQLIELGAMTGTGSAGGEEQ